MDIVTLAAVGVLVVERIIVHTFTAIKRCKSNCGCSSCSFIEKDHERPSGTYEVQKDQQTPSTTGMEAAKDL
jgi:hypothetical protein